MAEIESTAQAPAGTGEGIALSTGQAGDTAPAGSVSTQGAREQPRSQTAAPSEQAPTPANSEDTEFGWKSLEDAKRDHKALQRAFTKNQQAYAQLGDVQTLAQERAILSQLREHPGFIQWVQTELAKEATGSGDPDTAKALQIVQEQARQIAQEAVAPLYAAHVEQKVRTTFSAMDQEFGPEWQQLKPKMNELLQTWKRQGLVAPSVEQNFDYNFVKSLYAAAAAADPQFAAKAYQKRLEQKQAHTTTSQPGTAAAATASAPATSMRDAYAQARRELGLA